MRVGDFLDITYAKVIELSNDNELPATHPASTHRRFHIQRARQRETRFWMASRPESKTSNQWVKPFYLISFPQVSLNQFGHKVLIRLIHLCASSYFRHLAILARDTLCLHSTHLLCASPLSSCSWSGDEWDRTVPAAAATACRGCFAPVARAGAEVQSHPDGAESLQPLSHWEVPDRWGMVPGQPASCSTKRPAWRRGENSRKKNPK